MSSTERVRHRVVIKYSGRVRSDVVLQREVTVLDCSTGGQYDSALLDTYEKEFSNDKALYDEEINCA